MNLKNLRLNSQHGVSLSAFMMICLPVFLIIMAFAVDGLMLVSAQRRAVAMATIGVQAGAATVDFGGGAPSLSGNACAVAAEAACENVEGGCRAGVAAVSCAQNGNTLTLDVRLRAPHFLRSGFQLGANQVRVIVEVGPGYGINIQE